MINYKNNIAAFEKKATILNNFDVWTILGNNARKFIVFEVEEKISLEVAAVLLPPFVSPEPRTERSGETHI